MAFLRFGVAVFCVSVGAGAALAQQPRPNWRDSWDATEVMIPMRDGVKLHTVYFVPKGKTGPFPILMERTPYGSGTANRPPQRSSQQITAAGYILAYQDVRGKGASEGEYVNVKPILPKGKPGTDESTDTYDTVDYLIKNVPQNSGRVGLWGISYPGFYAGAGAVRNHPALKAVSPQAPVNDWFMGDDVAHRGVMFVQESFDFGLFFDLAKGASPIRIDRGTLSAYDWYLSAGSPASFEEKFLKGRMPYWQELMDNDTYNQYWKERALWRSFKDVGCAVMTVGGLFDKEDMWGALNLYKAGEKQNPGINNFLVMGPWSHGQWASPGGSQLGDFKWGTTTSSTFQAEMEFKFFEKYLRGDDKASSIPEATIFETGSNEFKTFPTWPPKGLGKKSLYAGPFGTLAWQAPTASGARSYNVDPMNPTPYLADYKTSRRAPGDWLARDQSFLDNRKDQTTFWLPALSEDLRVAGPITADLWVTTTGTDGDFVVQVIDEFPADTTETKTNGQSAAGAQFMVRGEIMRAKFRNSFEKPEPVIPGKPTRVRFELNDVLHKFKKGHRIGIRIMSSWFPIAERNPNQFLSRAKTTDADYRTAKVEVLYGPETPTRVEFGTLR